MLLGCLIIIPIVCVLIRLILYLIIKKYKKNFCDIFSIAGFSYNSEKDIFYSTKDAWQKNFGYSHIYDVLAPIFRMIIDTEPVRFYYNDRNWLITFWKGQYGIATGAEVGVYYTRQKKINKKTLYLPVSDNEMLDMDLVLYKNGKIIAHTHAKHWWLAIFKLGMFSRPNELSMDVNIIFPNIQMLYAFLESFKKLGYKPKDYTVIDNRFSFKYIKPHKRKVWTRTWLTDSISQFYNHKNVDLYNRYLFDFVGNNKINDSEIINSKNLIIRNNFMFNLLKNTLRKLKNSEHTIVVSEEEKNVVFSDSDVYSELRVDEHE